MAAPLAAQQPAGPTSVVQQAPTNPTCDCVTGDNGGGLRNLAAFAPLGFIGALAAAGAPALFAEKPATPGPVVASNTPPVAEPLSPTTEAARSATPATDPAPVAPPAAAERALPPDSLTRDGLRAPDTATPLPSVVILGSGLLAIGAFALARSRG
ncbi:MAG: hypothetical protein MUF21_12460 [Gemmatimonadaceae bacterium]|nr:hypothetical protein [Gemmatimonadaceae bacterium]